MVSIDYEDFRNADITDIIFLDPSNITIIGGNAFYGCTSLVSVSFDGTITTAQFSINEPFPGDLRAKYLAGGTGTYTSPEESNVWTKQ